MPRNFFERNSRKRISDLRLSWYLPLPANQRDFQSLMMPRRCEYGCTVCDIKLLCFLRSLCFYSLLWLLYGLFCLCGSLWSCFCHRSTGIQDDLYVAHLLLYRESRAASAWHEALHRKALIYDAFLYEKTLGRDTFVLCVCESRLQKFNERVRRALCGHHEHVLCFRDALTLDQSRNKADFAWRLAIVCKGCGDHRILLFLFGRCGLCSRSGSLFSLLLLHFELFLHLTAVLDELTRQRKFA